MKIHKNYDFCECYCQVINHSIGSKWSRNSDRTRSVSPTSYRILIRKISWFCKKHYFSKKQIACISDRFSQKLIFLEGRKNLALNYASWGGSKWSPLCLRKRLSNEKWSGNEIKVPVERSYLFRKLLEKTLGLPLIYRSGYHSDTSPGPPFHHRREAFSVYQFWKVCSRVRLFGSILRGTPKSRLHWTATF